MFNIKLSKILLLILISLLVLLPNKSFAMEKDFSSYTQVLTNTTNKQSNSFYNQQYEQEFKDCDSILGSYKDPKSVAWLLFKILNYIRILGPLAVVVLSGIEYTMAIINSDDDTMKKATTHLKTRLIMTGLLFMIPIITQLLFQVFGIVSDCGLLK